jgi:hypothetical protein
MTYLNDISSNIEILKVFAVVGVLMTFLVFLTIGLVIESKLTKVRVKKS